MFALPSSPPHPVPNQFVFGHDRGSGFENSYQPAPLQQPNSILHCSFGEARPFPRTRNREKHYPESEVTADNGMGRIAGKNECSRLSESGDASGQDAARSPGSTGLTTTPFLRS
jgi:hypothetical protein